MEMHQVRYFLALSRTLNFTRAAEECHVAQPSLTRAIKQLEEELGAELFRRERNLTHLTEFGNRMLPESATKSERISLMTIEGLDLKRTIYLYGVAGRQRSAAASALIRLMRAGDWTSHAAA